MFFVYMEGEKTDSLHYLGLPGQWLGWMAPEDPSQLQKPTVALFCCVEDSCFGQALLRMIPSLGLLRPKWSKEMK